MPVPVLPDVGNRIRAGHRPHYTHYVVWGGQRYPSAVSDGVPIVRPGQWRNYLGRPLRDPPGGTVHYTWPPLGSFWSGVEAIHVHTYPYYPVYKDGAVRRWLQDYYRNAPGGQHPVPDKSQNHQALANAYNVTLNSIPHHQIGPGGIIQNPIGIPDPGQAKPGVGPIKDFNPLNWFKNFSWTRVGEVLVGAIVIAVALHGMTKK